MPLYQSPRSNVRYPAQFSFAGEVLECEVRFRGETARFYPKKSWKVWFEDSSNPVGVRELNLNAEYSDRSLMRNALAMRLYQFIGHPAPNTEHISLMVNDDFMGVFVQVEEPDQELLRRYDYELGSLYKSENHGGSTAPLLDYDTYFWSWNKKVGGESDYIDGQRLFNQLLYLTYEDFAERISLLVDVENVLQYFAVAYAISSLDAVTKNTLLYFDPRGHLQQILPWDHDASFGNYWTGEYRPYFETVSEHPHLNHHLLFQRLMEYDAWRESFWSKVSFVIEHGFAAVEAEIDSTYELIKSDVYLDRAKIGTNAEFDDAISRLKGFLAARRSFLTDFPFVEKKKNLSSGLCLLFAPIRFLRPMPMIAAWCFEPLRAAPKLSWSNISRICRPTRHGEKRSRSRNSRCSTMVDTTICRRGTSSTAIVSCCPKTTRASCPILLGPEAIAIPPTAILYQLQGHEDVRFECESRRYRGVSTLADRRRSSDTR